MLPAGTLDRRIELLQEQQVQDAAGQPIGTWLPWAKVWASYKPLPGAEPFEGQRHAPKGPAEFRIRHRAGVTRAMRIRYEGATYDITDVQEIGRREGLLLSAFARPE